LDSIQSKPAISFWDVDWESDEQAQVANCDATGVFALTTVIKPFLNPAGVESVSLFAEGQ